MRRLITAKRLYYTLGKNTKFFRLFIPKHFISAKFESLAGQLIEYLDRINSREIIDEYCMKEGLMRDILEKIISLQPKIYTSYLGSTIICFSKTKFLLIPQDDSDEYTSCEISGSVINIKTINYNDIWKFLC